MESQLVDLEKLRQKLDRTRNLLGMTYDYLDRGRPDVEQRAATVRQVAVSEAEAKALEARLDAEVHRLRVDAPRVIEDWTSLHLSILNDILAETEDAEYLSRDDIRHFVARGTAAAWKAVQNGTRSYVHINAGYLEDYEDRVQAKLSALDDDVRRREATAPKPVGKEEGRRVG